LPRNSDEERDRLEQRRAGSGCFLIRLIPSACSEVPGHGAKIRSKILTPLVAQQAVTQQVLARRGSGRGGRRWSARVTHESDALDLQHRVFTGRDPKKIAASLKRSAERSRRRKADPFRALDVDLLYQSRRQEPAGQ